MFFYGQILGIHGHFYKHSEPVTMMWTLIITILSMSGSGMGWTYQYSNKTMNWTEAREWCWTNNYTDMVAIQNNQENDYLVSILLDRTKAPYYWIGIRKINGSWTWIGTNGTWAPNESWAPNEPNDKLNDEFCVEIYVNKANKDNHGKWNDDKCSKEKHPVCYKEQCNKTSCNGRGRCLETINNFTCVCESGFEGNRCKTVVTCGEPIPPHHGRIMNCSGPHGKTSFNSSCTFRCLEGFNLSGSPEVRCNSSGLWDAKEPICAANLTVNTTCQLSCVAGILLASPEVSCTVNGVWTEVWTEVWADDIWRRVRVLSGWRPVCASYQSVVMVAIGGWLLSTSCSICCCFGLCIKMKKHAKPREAEEGVMSACETEQPMDQ
ncbi:E-selectin isoform X3 [Esox lucius]|uniref:E-selectin isoform X3 n=1 Tax=Esox lucius TaxID=8010 RepID=UPI0009731E23|nr:E-selectin isoform X3 [Esox lucius]